MKAGNALAMDGDLLDWLKAGAGGGAFVAVLGLALRFLAWAFPFKASRDDRREDRLDRINDSLLKSLTADVADLKAENKEIRAELNACTDKHAKSEAEVERLRVMIEMPGIARQMAQQTIAADKQKERET